MSNSKNESDYKTNYIAFEFEKKNIIKNSHIKSIHRDVATLYT